MELLKTIRNSANVNGYYSDGVKCFQTNHSENSIDGGVPKVSVGRVIIVLAGSDGVKVDHVGGDEDGGQDVAEDEDADNGQQSEHSVLNR